jgi:hypothetical protein
MNSIISVHRDFALMVPSRSRGLNTTSFDTDAMNHVHSRTSLSSCLGNHRVLKKNIYSQIQSAQDEICVIGF